VKRLAVTGVGIRARSSRGEDVALAPQSLSGELDQTPGAAMDPATSVTATGAILNARSIRTASTRPSSSTTEQRSTRAAHPSSGTRQTRSACPAGFGDVMVSQPVTGLDDNTLYYARARASNANGETASNFVTVQTAIDHPDRPARRSSKRASLSVYRRRRVSR
jgi:hypothetical protein